MSVLWTLAIVNLLGAMSPGPDFFIVSQTSAAKGRLSGLLVGAGVATGVAFWSLCSLLGLKVLFDQFSWIQPIIACCGGLYLLWIGVSMLRGAFKSRGSEMKAEVRAGTYWADYARGLFTNLSNPKCLVFFASIFTVFIPPEMGLSTTIAAFLITVLEAFFWFALVTTFFSMQRIRRAYLRVSHWVDGMAGLLFVGFGGALIVEVIKEHFLSQ